jgi:hypothetical protein
MAAVFSIGSPGSWSFSGPFSGPWYPQPLYDSARQMRIPEDVS